LANPDLSFKVTDKDIKSRKDYWIAEDIIGHDPNEAIEGFQNLKQKGIKVGKDTRLKYQKPVGGGFGLVIEKKF
jgi:hypothetical protein